MDPCQYSLCGKQVGTVSLQSIKVPLVCGSQNSPTILSQLRISSSSLEVILTYLGILISIGQRTKSKGLQPWHMLIQLKNIVSCANHISRLQCFYQALRRSTRHYLMPVRRRCGFEPYLTSFNYNPKKLSLFKWTTREKRH